MSKCTVKILSKNEYLARLIVLIARELDFDASVSELPDGDINIIDSSVYVKGEYDPLRSIYLFETGKTIPKGVGTLISKPFLHKDLKETMLRVYDNLYVGSGDSIVIDGNKLMYGGSFLTLTDREAGLFKYLYQKANTPVSRKELLDKVWKGEASVDANVTDVYINYIRKKTREAFGIDVIRAVRGVGYMYTDKYSVFE